MKSFIHFMWGALCCQVEAPRSKPAHTNRRIIMNLWQKTVPHLNEPQLSSSAPEGEHPQRPTCSFLCAAPALKRPTGGGTQNDTDE